MNTRLRVRIHWATDYFEDLPIEGTISLVNDNSNLLWFRDDLDREWQLSIHNIAAIEHIKEK